MAAAGEPVVTLELRVRLEATLLAVSYKLANLDNRELGVFNRLRGQNLDGAASYAPAAVFVELEERLLHLRKMVLPIPDGLKVAEPIIPGITFLAPGASLVEHLTLPLPAPVDSPYRQAVLAGQSDGASVLPVERSEADSLAISVGVFVRAPEEKLFPLSPSYPNVFRTWPPGGPVARQVVASARRPLPAPITVLDYGIPPAP